MLLGQIFICIMSRLVLRFRADCQVCELQTARITLANRQGKVFRNKINFWLTNYRGHGLQLELELQLGKSADKLVSHMCNGPVRRVWLRIRLTYPQAASYRQTATSIWHDFTWSLFALRTPFTCSFRFCSVSSQTVLAHFYCKLNLLCHVVGRLADFYFEYISI